MFRILGIFRQKWILVAVIVCLAVATTVSLQFHREDSEDSEVQSRKTNFNLPRRELGEEYVSSDACKSCHPEAYRSWHATYHRSMTQWASPETVVAPFDDIHLTNRGRSYHLENREDEFWVQMPDPDWEGDLRHAGVDLSQVPEAPIVERRVVMTTGSHHYQGYWVPSRHGNQLWQLPFVFHFEQQRWLPREDVFLHPPSNYRSLVIWNVNCIQCHVVAGKPGLGPDKNALYSSFVEMGIACESCHGPGANHVRHHSNSFSDRSHPNDQGETRQTIRETQQS